MATQTIVSYVDDIDGSVADKTTTFSLDGKTWEIDLSSANIDRLNDALAEFIEHGRAVKASGKGGSETGGNKARPKVDREQTQAIREWARNHGFKVSDRGRVPGEVLEAYHQAQAA